MRVVIQRVTQASVSVSQNIVGAIENGILILLGIEPNDNNDDIQWLINKIIGLRIFNDHEGKMNLSIEDINGKFLVISQFTLFASTKKGNRPSYITAAKPGIAVLLYQEFINQLNNKYRDPTECGIFGADMQVSLINDGPVTIIIDSKNRE